MVNRGLFNYLKNELGGGSYDPSVLSYNSEIEEAIKLVIRASDIDDTLVVVKENPYTASRMFDMLASFYDDKEIVLYTPEESMRAEAIAASFENRALRTNALYEILAMPKKIIVTTVYGLIRHLPDKELLKGSIQDLKVGDTISLTAIRADYKGTPQLEGIVAAVNYEMVNEPTPATLAEVMSYSDVLNDSSKINAQRVYEITVTIDSWEDGETDGTEYGNFYVTDEDGNKCFVYGATAQTGAISYNYKGSSCYSMGNKKDWLTNDVTKDLTIGDKITMTVVRADYNGTIQIVGENVRKLFNYQN